MIFFVGIRRILRSAEHHEYQLYLAVENIDHTRTKARHPQTQRILRTVHRTIQEEFYATAFRKKLYHGLVELQADLDDWMREYNLNRTHSGKYCYGKRPCRPLPIRFT
jgi:transposase InsO family protein